jgi:hypothetical protein
MNAVMLSRVVSIALLKYADVCRLWQCTAVTGWVEGPLLGLI